MYVGITDDTQFIMKCSNASIKILLRALLRAIVQKTKAETLQKLSFLDHSIFVKNQGYNLAKFVIFWPFESSLKSKDITLQNL